MRDAVAAAAVAVGAISHALGITTVAAGLGAALFAVARNARGKGALPGDDARVRLGRWLNLSLKVTLAGDIVASIAAPTWGDIMKLGSIVVLSTLLGYSLTKGVAELARRPG